MTKQIEFENRPVKVSDKNIICPYCSCVQVFKDDTSFEQDFESDELDLQNMFSCDMCKNNFLCKVQTRQQFSTYKRKENDKAA